MNAAQILDAVINQVGTDASRATILTVLNEAYDSQVTDARWLRTEASIGTTVANTDVYVVPATIIEAYGVRVGGYTYTPIGEDAMWSVKQATAYVRSGTNGVYSQGYNSAGDTTITLQPSPATSGDAILVYAAVQPTPLTDSSSSTPITPRDMHSSLIDGTAGIILTRVDERPELGGPFSQAFAVATEKLRRRKNSLLWGGAPAQLQVKGIHY